MLANVYNTAGWAQSQHTEMY